MNTKLEELKAKVAEIKKEIEKLEKEDSKYFDLSKNSNWNLGDRWKHCEIDKYDIQIRTDSEYRNAGFFLNNRYDWEIIIDSERHLVLVPTKK